MQTFLVQQGDLIPPDFVGKVRVMRTVIQRVSGAKVWVDGRVVSEIQKGVVTLLGIERGDTEEMIQKMMTKICELRIFEDEAQKMNRSLKDIAGSHLIVSQFTLLADCSQGRRPSFLKAETPERAKSLYEMALHASQALGVPTCGGIFQADMKVELTNDGPATFVLELKD